MNVTNTLRLESGERITRCDASGDEALRGRIELLDKDDQLLIHLATTVGVSHRKIAELMGLEPGTVSRRLRRVWQRVANPIVTRLLEPGCTLSGPYRRIGVEHFLCARPTPRIAAELGVTSAEVREVIEFIRTWHRMTRPG